MKALISINSYSPTAWRWPASTVRYGYRKIAELLRRWADWVINDKRVERLAAARKAIQAWRAMAGGRLVHSASCRILRTGSTLRSTTGAGT